MSGKTFYLFVYSVAFRTLSHAMKE